MLMFLSPCANPTQIHQRITFITVYWNSSLWLLVRNQRPADLPPHIHSLAAGLVHKGHIQCAQKHTHTSYKGNEKALLFWNNKLLWLESIFQRNMPTPAHRVCSHTSPINVWSGPYLWAGFIYQHAHLLSFSQLNILHHNIKTSISSREQLATLHLLRYNYFVFILNAPGVRWCRRLSPFSQTQSPLCLLLL